MFRKIRKLQEKKWWEKTLARQKLNYHLKKGIILRPKLCSICFQSEKLDGHHKNYKKPLEVIWCCRKCHLGIHNKNRKPRKLPKYKPPKLLLCEKCGKQRQSKYTVCYECRTKIQHTH